MKDYTFIESTWGDKLIKHYAAYVSLATLDISEENKHLLEYAGLPLIHSHRGWELLPFTFYHLVKVENKELYLLGDTSLGNIGHSFLGLESKNEEIYRIYQGSQGKLSYQWLNQSLYQYLLFMAHYTRFMDKDYPLPSKKSKKQVQADYQVLKENLANIDAKAMSDRSYLWADIIYSMQVGEHGDYFNDFDPDSLPPLSPEAQKRLENGEEFPF